MMQRRTLLKTGAATLAAGALPRPVLAADAEIVLSPETPGAEISPHIYGHFIEHLGGVIYDGIWVGPNSRIANLNGIRAWYKDRL